MRKSCRGRLSSMALLAVSFIFLGTVFAAGSDPVADIAITPGQVTWSPNVKAEKWVLTVSGQGIYLREVVQAGEPLRLQPNAAD